MKFEYSVVATSFNDEIEIANYIKNISEQTISPAEIVIADGGSNDSTIAIIEKMKQDIEIPIKLVKGKNLNIPEGYNAAIKASTYPNIGITGIGNKYESSYFEKLIYVFDNENKDIVYSPIRGEITTAFSERYVRNILDGNKGQRLKIASNHGALVKKYVFERCGYFYEDFIKAGEDVEFYERARSLGFSQAMVDNAVVLWDVPKNVREFNIQNKNYTIAKLQIEDNKQIIKEIIKNSVPFIVLFLLLVGFIITKNVIPAILVVFVCVLYFLRKIMRGHSPLLSILSKLFQLYYMVRYIKYASNQYKVKRKI